MAEVEAYVAQAAIRTEIDRLSTDREKTGVAHRGRRDQPDQRRTDPDLHRRLRPRRLRDRRDHGRPGPRRARLRVRGRRTGCRSGVSWRRAWRTPTRRWTRRSSRTPAARSSSTAGRTPGCPPTRVARRSSRELEARGKGTAVGHLPPARLADQPPALLGHADPGHLLRAGRDRARARRGPAGPTARTPSTTAAAARTRSTATRRS